MNVSQKGGCSLWQWGRLHMTHRGGEGKENDFQTTTTHPTNANIGDICDLQFLLLEAHVETMRVGRSR